MPRGVIGMKEMNAIFEVTDALGIDREEITVPLEKAGEGAVRKLPDGKVEIVVPERVPLKRWQGTLRQELERLGYQEEG